MTYAAFFSIISIMFDPAVNLEYRILLNHLVVKQPKDLPNTHPQSI